MLGKAKHLMILAAVSERQKIVAMQGAMLAPHLVIASVSEAINRAERSWTVDCRARYTRSQ